MKKNNTKRIFFILFLIILISGCRSMESKPVRQNIVEMETADVDESLIKDTNENVEKTVVQSANEENENSEENHANVDSLKEKEKEKLEIDFIDVGQADSILIESNGSFMLIDGGNNEDATRITSYLKERGVKKLEYVIGTHPHEDHIGALDTVIKEFQIGEILLPEIAHTSQTFEEVLNAISDKGLKITKPVSGDTYEIGVAQFVILGPNKDYGDNYNNWSVGIKLIYGENRFIMCGDAEQEAEEDIVKTGIDIQADVLKVGHHGSTTSSSDTFLNAINPKYAVVSCGKDNTYGLPDSEILKKFKSRGISVFRTDLQGTIIARSDGTTITWNITPSTDYSGGQIASGSNQEEIKNFETETENKSDLVQSTYILNNNTKKFHYESCDSAQAIAEKNKEISNASREELIEQGYAPCRNCNP